MTAVTGRILIDVSALPFVFTIHRRLCVFVTIDAFEERIIRSGGVTIRTVIPPTRTMFIPNRWGNIVHAGRTRPVSM